MRRSTSVLLSASLALIAFGAVADKAPPALPPCIQVAAFARYGAYGYDHIVTINNSCDRGADCVVSTNVNPDPIAVRVASGARESVLTFRGSPASEFSARVRCVLDK